MKKVLAPVLVLILVLVIVLGTVSTTAGKLIKNAGAEIGSLIILFASIYGIGHMVDRWDKRITDKRNRYKGE